MRLSHFRAASVAALAALASVGTLHATTDDAAPPLLSLEEAVEIAQKGNHLLVATTRAIDETEERVAALKTRRLPGLHLDAYGARLLNSLDFTMPGGSTGAPPASASTFTVPADWYAVGAVSASQPLTQQYRLGLSIEVARFDRDIAKENLRRERQRVIAEVRSTYYQISATVAGILAQRDIVRAVEELDAVTSRYLEEGMVLRSDALEVKARLSRERQRLSASESSLHTQHDHLNQLLARDVRTPFLVATPTELVSSAPQLTLEEARERAIRSRPEIRAAALRTAQATTSRKIVLSGWIPDVSLVASYVRLSNTQTLPDHAAAVGLMFSWEPFDWGRKKHEAAERAYQIDQSRELKSEVEQQILVEVGQRWREVQDAAQLLEATRLEESASTASLETDQRRYRENAAILRDVLRTEARLSVARQEFTGSLADYWSAAAELERTIGYDK